MSYLLLSILLLFTPAKENEKSIRKKNNKKAPPGTVWIRDSLYMDKTEIRNADYREYIYWLKRIKGQESSEYIQALPDTLVWRNKLAYNEPFVNLYFQHQAYKNYPVVGISHDQAINYCQWRTNVVNAYIHINVNKIDFNDTLVGNTPKYIIYRLPDTEEWEEAARGGLRDVLYPWGGCYLRNYRGCALANFRIVGDERISYNDSLKGYEVMSYMSHPVTLDDNYSITAPVETFPVNDFGLYNMAGNVAEMVSEKGISKGGSWKLPGYHCRIDQDWKYSKPSNDIGFRCICEKLIDY